MTLSLLANTWDKKVGVLVYLRSQAAETVLAALAPQRADIEAALGEPLEWNPHPEQTGQSDPTVAAGRYIDQIRVAADYFLAHAARCCVQGDLHAPSTDRQPLRRINDSRLGGWCLARLL